MNWTLARYRTKADKADENARLIKAVLQELERKSPSGLRYAAMRTADDTFVHIVSRRQGAMEPFELQAFRAFQEDIRERCIDPPTVLEASLVGDYRIFAPDPGSHG